MQNQTSSNSVIKVTNVNKTYRGKIVAVKRLSFEVERSTCFGFLGPNGAGKTTMLKMIYGKALRDIKPPGEIEVLGFDPLYNELNIKHLSGVVPQENSLDIELNVCQNLHVFAKLYGLSGRDEERRIDELLEFMELSEKKQCKISELSGGMQRRLIIARALLNNPRLLILDEPTTGLDPQVRHLIWDKLHQLKRKGITILLTTHYMEEAFQICDKVLIMNNGEKVLEGNPKQLLKQKIEKYVLEVYQNEAVDGLIGLEQVRYETGEERTMFYSNDIEQLKALTAHFTAVDYYIRQANLEDLFLRTTGRTLQEDSE
ncbi:MAG: ABC transporter ATP-binding protein [Candidatus Margulisiibacteriota bacterium]